MPILLHHDALTSYVARCVLGGMRVTQRELAQRTGLNQSTVCRALRGDARLARATVEQVQCAAKEMGYQMDPHLSHLAREKWARRTHPVVGELAWLTDAPDQDHSYPHLSRGMDGAQRKAKQLGYAITRYDFASMRAVRIADILKARGTLGVIASTLYDPQLLSHFPFNDFVGVGINPGPILPPYDLVQTDSRRAVELAWQQAQARGYRRPGLLTQHLTGAEDEKIRFGSFALLESTLDERPAMSRYLAVELSESRQLLKQQVRDWFFSARPDVIFGLNPLFFHLLREAGIRIPEETGFVALLSSSNPMDEQPMSRLEPGNPRLGESAVQWLDQKIRNREQGSSEHTRRILIAARWVEGSTLPTKD